MAKKDENYWMQYAAQDGQGTAGSESLDSNQGTPSNPSDKARLNLDDRSMQDVLGFGGDADQVFASIEGFNRPFERVAEGAMKPIFGSGLLGQEVQEGFERTQQKSQARYDEDKANYPVQTGMGEFGGTTAVSAPFFGGGSAAIGKIAPNLPKFAQHILGGILGGGAEAATMDPGEGSRLENMGEGALWGGGGAAIAPGLAKIAQGGWNLGRQGMRGLQKHMGNERIAVEDMIQAMTPEELSDALKNQQSGKRLGLQLTPAEASGSPILSAQEKQLGSNTDRAKQMGSFKKGQKQSQKQAIENFGDLLQPKKQSYARDIQQGAEKIIGDKEKALAEKARPFYDAAEHEQLHPNTLNALLRDSNLNRVFGELMNDSRYASELENFAPTSVKVLDRVKRRLDAEINTALERGESGKAKDQDLARVLRDSRKKLVNKLDEISPNYKKARSIYEEGSPPINLFRDGDMGKLANLNESQLQQASRIIFDPQETDPKVLHRMRDQFLKEDPEAWRGIVRNEMERRMINQNLGKTDNYGSNFFDNILANERQYNQFYQALKGDRKAQLRMRDMKGAFKNLLNSYTPKTAAGHSATNVSQMRNLGKQAEKLLGNLAGGKRDQAMINIITDQKWDDQFREAIKAMEQKNLSPMRKLLKQAGSEEAMNAISQGASGTAISNVVEENQ